MATTLQSLQGTKHIENIKELQDISVNNMKTLEGVHLFGVRHFSPSGAYHIRRFLAEIKPDCVLIEGPSDASYIIEEIVSQKVKPPIAMMCYTTDVPVNSVVYPFVDYSPEYQGMLWSKKNNKVCKFIDLPSYNQVSIHRYSKKEKIEMKIADQEQKDEKAQNYVNYINFRANIDKEIAKISGEVDFDTYWERQFEHNLAQDSYRKSVYIYSAMSRQLTENYEYFADPTGFALNLLRESYMKKCIMDEINSGVNPEKIVVICGAYHVLGLINNTAISESEIKNIPSADTNITLMPYSYYKISSMSGYGAGNNAPYYYEMMWNAIKKDSVKSLSALYLSKVSKEVRNQHGYSSTANVIEANRLAHGLQYINGGLMPTLKDLHDSVVATIGEGELGSVAESLMKIDVGNKMGSLPEGVSQTPIQDDMNRIIKKLKLDKYKTTVAQDLNLDLRENRKVKSRELAFIDLERSVFFNRLKLLGIDFAKEVRSNQDSATWAETWVLQWSTETEIKLIESVLLGDTIVAAASYALKEQLKNVKDVEEVAKLVRVSCVCRLSDIVYDAVEKLQEFANDSYSFISIAGAAREMSFLIQYSGIRNFETENIEPILKQLFLKASLVLMPSASCDTKTAIEVSKKMIMMHNISQENYDLINDEVWIENLLKLSKSDNKNALLCGFAFSILLERGRVTEEDLITEVSRHLSIGNTPEVGAEWFEGLSMRNRYVLLSRRMLWEQLDIYISSLDEEEFKRAIVCLRRTFANFEPYEKNGLCEILADIWKVDVLEVAEVIQDVITEEEEAIIEDLNDFDFGDLF